MRVKASIDISSKWIQLNNYSAKKRKCPKVERERKTRATVERRQSHSFSRERFIRIGRLEKRRRVSNKHTGKEKAGKTFDHRPDFLSEDKNCSKPIDTMAVVRNPGQSKVWDLLIQSNFCHLEGKGSVEHSFEATWNEREGEIRTHHDRLSLARRGRWSIFTYGENETVASKSEEYWFTRRGALREGRRWSEADAAAPPPFS